MHKKENIMLNKYLPLELLSPARDLECGLAAINHGADAVYIGAPDFGARKSASNTISDIEKLVRYAHLYKARVFVALNTILYDHELDDAVKMAHQLYQVGVDALIIQDFGLLEASLPPIAIHSSTQMDNRTPEKVLFLEQAGFEQVVLARELNLEQIAEIRSKTNVNLEFFIHGALCVSYSGQCYMSQSINKRSANRGDCGQPCRLKYEMTDKNGLTLIKDKHLLSMKDLNLTNHIEQLIDAGISSFKIEGRLKDKDYVANITAHYRTKLDEILERRPELSRASSGKSTFNFTPDPDKSFNRNFTSYFIDGRQKEIWSVDSPKSTGKKMGKVLVINKNQFQLDSLHDIANGDGLCFFDRKMELKGLRVNKVENGIIFPLSMEGLYAGATVFRNYDIKFSSQFKNDTAQRKIVIDLHFEERGNGDFSLTVRDQDDISTTIINNLKPQEPHNRDQALDQMKKQLMKTGNTPFEVAEIHIRRPWFIPAAELNSLRREALEQHEQTRINHFHPADYVIPCTHHPFPVSEIKKNGNVVNQLAVKFYERHAAQIIEQGYEMQSKYDNEVVMTTKHCILSEQDKCLLLNPSMRQHLPLFISSEKDRYELKFNCKECEMQIIRREK